MNAGRTDNRDPDTGPTAAQVLRPVVDDQVAAVQAADQELRLNDLSGVHRMRVALHRLSSTLATFRPLLHDSVDPLTTELGWLAAELRPAQDAQTQMARHLGNHDVDVSDLEETRVVLGPSLLALAQRARARADEAWESERYAALIGDLRQLFASNLVVRDRDAAATRVLPPLVGEALRRVRERAEQLDAGSERDVLIHDLRAATRRAGDVSPVLVPLFGKPASKLGRQLQRLQDALGEWHDSDVARTLLLTLLRTADLDENGAMLAHRLLAREEAMMSAVDARIPKLLGKLRRRGEFLDG